MSRYSVMTRGMCETADMKALNVVQKCIYLTALGLRRQNITGMVYISANDLAGIVGSDEKEIRKALNGEKLRKKLEFFGDSGVLWIKDFISQQFAGKISPQQKKGIINRLMEYPDRIVKKFLAFNRDKLNLSRQDLKEFDFEDISEYNSSEPALQSPPDTEIITDDSQSGNTLITDNYINTPAENIYFTHSNTLSDTSKPEQDQEPDQEPDQKKEPQQEPDTEDIPPFAHNGEYQNRKGMAVVSLYESVLFGSEEDKPPSSSCRSGLQTAADRGAAAVPPDESVFAGSEEDKHPSSDVNLRNNSESLYNDKNNCKNSDETADAVESPDTSNNIGFSEPQKSCTPNSSHIADIFKEPAGGTPAIPAVTPGISQIADILNVPRQHHKPSESSLCESVPTTHMSSGQLKNVLVEMGVNGKSAESLIQRFDTQRIFRQIVWFPLRRMKSAGALVRAVEGDWKKPYDEDEGALRREARSCALRNPGCVGGREEACGFCTNGR